MYIAPEVQSRKRGPRNHSKADMYSLGVRLFRVSYLSCLNCYSCVHHLLQIVFFEMNYTFTTGAERIAVLEDIRKPAIYFPSDWDAHRTRQRESKYMFYKIYIDAFLLKAHYLQSSPYSYSMSLINDLRRLSYRRAPCYHQDWKTNISKELCG